MSPFNTQQLATVPLSLFGGLIAETDPSDAPEGSSPLLQDVEFDVGSVRQRRGLAQILSTSGITNGAAVNTQTFVLQNQDVQTLAFMRGNTHQLSALAFEDVTNNPGILTLLANNFALYMKTAIFGGRAYMAFSDGSWGADVPLKYNGTTITRISQDGPGANATAADSATAGNVSAGLHQLVVMFLTADGYITRPSPFGSWTAAGSKKVSLTNLPIGPANVVARIVAFTAAGADFFFYIPVPTTGSTSGTVINDNVSTTATLDFTDTTLQAATSIDTAGNNLFALDTLGNCLGSFVYSNRTFFWGERNKIQNLLNPSFDGGFDNATNTTPLGWTQDTSGGAKVATQTGFAYQISVGGTIGTHYGQIHQPAAVDENNAPIFAPNTQYVFRAQILAIANQSVTAVLSSVSTGFSSSATLTVSAFVSGHVGYFTGTFNLATPAAIPSDLLLTVYANSNGTVTTVTLDEMEFYPVNNPFLGQQLRVSYANNPESFDGVTGIVGLAEAGNENIKRLFQIRETLYVQTDGAIYATSDNGLTEPSGWSIEKVSNTVGTVSAFSGVTGEEFDFSVHRTGLYVFTGGEPTKSNQEIFRSVSGISLSWEQINWSQSQTIWMANDIARRQIYVGAPITGSPNNIIFMMDYKELNSASQISSEGPVHTSYSGKVISWEPGRKWAPWNISALGGNMCQRPDGTFQLLLGVGGAWLQPTEGQYSDNGVAINSFYTTYGFPPEDFANQNPMLGMNRLLYSFVTMYVGGLGTLNITAFPSSLTNSLSATYALLLTTTDPGEDMEVPIRVAGERCFFRVGTNAVGSFWQLNKFTARMRSHPWSRIRHVN